MLDYIRAMDLVIQRTVHKPFRSFATQVCESTHRTHIQGLSPVSHEVEVTTPAGFAHSLLALLKSGKVSAKFILTRDNIMLTGACTPTHYAHQHSMWLHRKGLEQDAMVNTIRIVAEKGAHIKDHEVHAPMLMDTAILIALLEEFAHENILVRTLYHNIVSKDAVKIPDPLLRLWLHGMSPQGPIVALDDTCYKHKNCLKWIEEHASSAVQA